MSGSRQGGSFLSGVIGCVSVDCCDFQQPYSFYFIAAEPSRREFKVPQAAYFNIEVNVTVCCLLSVPVIVHQV